jgi:hypothetical protein
MPTQEEKLKNFQRDESLEGLNQTITPTALAGELVGAVSVARSIRGGLRGGTKAAGELDDILAAGDDVAVPAADDAVDAVRVTPTEATPNPTIKMPKPPMQPPRRTAANLEAAEDQRRYAGAVEEARGRATGTHLAQQDYLGSPDTLLAETGKVKGVASTVADSVDLQRLAQTESRAGGTSAMVGPAVMAGAMSDSGGDSSAQAMGAELADLADLVLPEDLNEAALRSSPVLWAAYKSGLPLSDIADAVGAVLDSTPMKLAAAGGAFAAAPAAAGAAAGLTAPYMFIKERKEAFDRPEWSTLKTMAKNLGPVQAKHINEEFLGKLKAMPASEISAAFDAGLISDDLFGELSTAGGSAATTKPMPAPIPPANARPAGRTAAPASQKPVGGRDTWSGYGGYTYRNNTDGSFTILKAPEGMERQVGLVVRPSTKNSVDPKADPHSAIKAEAVARGAIKE